MKSPNSVGIKEIARLAGVSIGTVDRVLHNRPGVSPNTKKKVLSVIKKTGYKKNIIASRLKLASTRKIKIAVLIPEIKTEWSYWKLPQNGIDKAVNELKEQGISIVYFYFSFSKPESFIRNGQNILKENFDGLITVPFLESECNKLLALNQENNIPIVFLDTERPLQKSANFIRQKSFNAGMVAGRLLHGLVGNQGTYYVINILNKNTVQINNKQREIGFRTFFERNVNEKVEIITFNHPLENQVEIPASISMDIGNNEPKGIFVTNARSFLIPPILKQYNIQNTYLIGFDLNRQNLQYLKNGDINFLINQQPEYQGYAAIKGLYKYLTENDDSQLSLEIPIEILVKENVFQEDMTSMAIE